MTRKGARPGAVGAGARPEHIGQYRHPPGTREPDTTAENRHDTISNQSRPQPKSSRSVCARLGLEDRVADLGADMALAVSLAYGRASGPAMNVPLYGYLAGEAGTEPVLPGLLAAVASGGLHQTGAGLPFQQMMLATGAHPPSEDIPAILEAELELGTRCCVSHPSLKDGEIAICDLPIAIGASWIKVGCPRRGDRTAKYNRVLRLKNSLTQTPRSRGGLNSWAA